MCESQKNIYENPYFIMELETGYVILGWFQRFKGTLKNTNCRRFL